MLAPPVVKTNEALEVLEPVMEPVEKVTPVPQPAAIGVPREPKLNVGSVRAIALPTAMLTAGLKLNVRFDADLMVVPVNVKDDSVRLIPVKKSKKKTSSPKKQRTRKPPRRQGGNQKDL